MSKILVLDDSSELLEMFSIMFKKYQYDCATANCTDSLYKQLQTNLPDLVLIDVRLNGIDGREICKELKTRNAFRTIPIILMSSSPSKLKDYTNFNADGILEKPFEMTDLLAKIDDLLHTLHPNTIS